MKKLSEDPVPPKKPSVKKSSEISEEPDKSLVEKLSERFGLFLAKKLSMPEKPFHIQSCETALRVGFHEKSEGDQSMLKIVDEYNSHYSKLLQWKLTKKITKYFVGVALGSF